MRERLDILYVTSETRPRAALLQAARRAGLHVIDVRHAEEALELLGRYGGFIDAVVIPPGYEKGRQALAQVRARYGSIPFIELADEVGTDPHELVKSIRHALRRQPSANVRPAPLVHVEPADEGHIGYAAFALDRIIQPRNADEQEHAAYAALRWHAHLLSVLALGPAGVQFHLRYLYDESTAPGLRLFFFLTARASSAARARRKALHMTREMAPYLVAGPRAGGGVYRFVSVTDHDDLQRAMVPFLPRSTSQFVCRPAEEVGEAYQKPDTLLPPSPVRPGPAATLEYLCHLLTQQQAPTLLEVWLRPATLTTQEASQFHSLLDLNRLASPADRSAEDRIRTLLRQHPRLFDVRLFAAQRAKRLSSNLQAVLERDLVGVPLNAAPASATLTGGVLLLHPRSDPGRERLPHLFTPLEASRLFRLPVPMHGGLAGIQATHAAHEHLPERLSRAGTLLGVKAAGHDTHEVRLAPDDLHRHLYITGQTGTGKTTLLTSMLGERLEAGAGVGLIDPHGDLLDRIWKMVPAHRRADIVCFDPTDTNPERPSGAGRSVRLNLLDYDPRYPEQRSLLIDSLFGLFHEVYDMQVAGGPMFETYMRNALLLVMDDPRRAPGTLLDVVKVFQDDAYRAKRLGLCTNPLVVDFWEREATHVTSGSEHSLQNIAPYITSKLNALVYNDYLRAMLSERRSTLNFRTVMDEGQILLIRLPKGRLGSFSTRLFGTVLFTRLFMAALSREDQPETERRSFFLFVDEFQTFTSRAVASMLSEARKYGLALVLANQTLWQLPENTRHAVLGNAGNLVFFRPGVMDYEHIAPYVSPPFDRAALLGLPNFTAVARLLVDGHPTAPFLFQTQR